MTETLLSNMKALSFKFDEGYEPDVIFVKEYSPVSYDEEMPLGRTLFVAKIPLYLDVDAVKKLFSQVGPVVSVKLLKKKPCEDDDDNYKDTYSLGFQCAYVVYKTRDILLKVLDLETFKTLTNENFTPIKGFVDQYYESIRNRYIVLDEIQSSKQEKEDIIDEEGWTVVTSKSKKSDPNKVMDKSIQKKKKKRNVNFYTFQIKESKMQHLTALMEGYEEAKKKVAKMKQNRLFKPV